MEMRPPSSTLQAVDEALVELAQQLRLGQPAVFEDHLAGGAGAQAELVFLLAGAEARRALFDDERRDAVLRGGRSVTAIATQTSA